MYQLLDSQLCTPTYKFRGTKMLVETKEDIKKRLGRSPDHADTYVIALWAWPHITTEAEDVKHKKQWKELAERYRSPWAVR
jgi:hypothetical protein